MRASVAEQTIRISDSGQFDAEKTAPAQIQPNLRLRLLTYNIQTGIATRRYRQYLTHSWKHVLPHGERIENLKQIARLLREYDVIGLQEVDGGSLRSGFINQTEYLARRAHFPFWYDQTNRNLGKFAQHSIGLLSRFPTTEIIEHKLPGIIPGRGALVVRFGNDAESLLLIILHLALGRRARLRQLEFISELVNAHDNVIVMGDMNCQARSEEMVWLMNHTELTEPVDDLHTFPSWRPLRNIDHILVSPSLSVEDVKVLNYPLSDHLPIAMTVTLPDSICISD